MKALLIILFLVSCQNHRVPASKLKTNCILNLLELTSFYRDEEVLKHLKEADPSLPKDVELIHKTEVHQIFFWGEGPITGVFKPELPDNSLSNPDVEILVYKLDRMLNLGIVPPTTKRRVYLEGVSTTEGSIQLFKKGDDYSNWRFKNDLYGSWEDFPEGLLNKDLMERQYFLDYLISNKDRHWGNFIIDDVGDVISIDHGAAFDRGGAFWGSFDQRARAMDHFFTTERGERVVKKLRNLDRDRFAKFLREALSEDEIRDTFQRIDLLLNREDAKRVLELDGFDWYPSSVAMYMSKLRKEKDLDSMLLFADTMVIDRELIHLFNMEVQGHGLFLKKVRDAVAAKGGIYLEMVDPGIYKYLKKRW